MDFPLCTAPLIESPIIAPNANDAIEASTKQQAFAIPLPLGCFAAKSKRPFTPLLFINPVCFRILLCKRKSLAYLSPKNIADKPHICFVASASLLSAIAT